MTYPATNSNEATKLIIDGGNQLHEIINEDAVTTITTESGEIPSVRKAITDTFLFQEPIAWNQGSDETVFNQLRTFNNETYWAPTATLSTPIPMGATPVGDSNWKIAPVGSNNSVIQGWDTQSQNEVMGAKIFPESDTLSDGDTVPVGTTHLRILVGGIPALVSMVPISSGVVSSLTETGATLGVTPVVFTLREITFNDINEMIAYAGDYPIAEGSIVRISSGQSFTLSPTPSSVQEIAINNTTLYANIIEGDKYYGEAFGGFIYDSTTQVSLGKIYLNLIKTDANYGSYLYFDAPEMPVSPIDYNSSYGGTVKNGIFAFTGRDAIEKRTLLGYRAGFDTTSTFCTYIGQQAGEGTVDIKDATATGGSVGVGLIALYNSLSRSTVAIGMESGNQSNSDNSFFGGTYSGGAVVGDKLVGIGYQACYQATTVESVGIGYQALVSATGDKCTATGVFSQNSATGPETCSYGHRSLSSNAGSFNAAYGNWSGFVTGGMTANNVAFFGYEAGRESNVDGAVGVGRSAGENNTGSFASFLGYLTGQNNTHARVTLLGQGAVATGADQLQLGNSSTTSYSFGPVQDRSDIRDKLDIKALTDSHIAFFMDVQWRQYRMNYRDSYYDVVEIEDEEGNVKLERVSVENDESRAGTRYHIGAVAQQVEDAMKKHSIDFAGLQHHAVNGGEDVYTIGYQEFIGIQGEIIQRQQRRLDSIEERLNLAGI